MSKPLRVVFAGTPQFAAAHLESLLRAQHNVIAVYTQPDRPAGRGKQLKASPVKEIALAHSLAVYQPATLKTNEAADALAQLNADVLIVVAYGLILPKTILALPRLGCINVHASLLPRWRGAAPIHRAIEAGDEETGVTIMQMDEGLDTGPMLRLEKISITAQHTTQTLTRDLEQLGPATLLNTLNALEETQRCAVPQPSDGVTYAEKISKSEAMIEWSQSATVLARKIRALNPAPGCFSTLGNQRLKVWEALPVSLSDTPAHAPGTLVDITREQLCVACGDGVLAITRLQLPNKKPMSIADILNGNQVHFSVGDRFENVST
jgi:methionyl-tRNA formyltransferase